MESRFSIRWLDVMAVAALVAFVGYRLVNRTPHVGPPVSPFAAQVDLSPLYRTAVHAEGRLRSFESHAKRYVAYISGPRSIGSQSHGFTYLDMIFSPEEYQDRDIAYVKNKQVLAQIIHLLQETGLIDEERAQTMQRSRLVAPDLLRSQPIVQLLDRLSRDLMRTARQVDILHGALTVSRPEVLRRELRLIPPPDGDRESRWLAVDDFRSADGMPADAIHAGLSAPPQIDGLAPEVQNEITDAWSALREAWREEDAGEVNRQIVRLTKALPDIAPDLYPESGRLAMESWYFRNKGMTWVWLIYLACVVPLLMSVIYKWDRARSIGMALFVVAFLAHTASLGIRWYVSGRWPNSNMFEAVTTSVWFGGVLALLLEVLLRRTPFRNLFALGSSVASMAALMAAYFMPAGLDASIGNKMAALHDVWLYIHTNMIIWSYAVIGLAAVTALLQLRHRWCLAWDRQVIPKRRLLVLPVAVVVLNYAAYKLLMHFVNPVGQGLSTAGFLVWAWLMAAAALYLVMELMAARQRSAEGIRLDRSASGGAASLIFKRHAGDSFLRAEPPTAGQVFDGATMVLLELAFIMLWTGIIMGAIWADHSWGRPWGWDPKEVFALNTFLIFLILIHVRLKVRDKAFWTAVLAVLGFEVMMFNWIVVNFVVTGLHSYA
jgi:ABC-type transport system involved in cytochrome c biogenesis permease subunit